MLSLSAMQGIFLCIHLNSESLPYIAISFNTFFFFFFIHAGITGFKSHCRMERLQLVINADIERMVNDLTAMLDNNRPVENVNWRRDGF